MTAHDSPVECSMDIASDRPRGSCSRGRARAISAVLVLLLLVAGVLFIAHDKTGQNGDKNLSRYFLLDSCDDIAIVGGGISGTYAAWKLRERGLSISLYEYSNRIGGRLHTIQFPSVPDINVEMGAMRLIPSVHHRVVQTAVALNLSVVDFPLGMGYAEDSLFYLRGVHMRRRNLGNDNNPYNLKPSEQYLKGDPEQLDREYFVNYTSYKIGDALNDSALLYSMTSDGTPLYAQSVDVAYATMGVSHEAVDYLQDTNGFHYLYSDAVSSLQVPIESHYAALTRADPVKTIAEGMEALPQGLARGFLNAGTRHQVVYNQQLWKIEKKADSTYQLGFWPTETSGGQTQRKQGAAEVTKCAKKVILSIPRIALDSVDWEGFRDPEVSRFIKHSIQDAPAAKIFLAYDRPWWKALPFTFSHSISDLPNRQTYDFGTSGKSNKAVLLAAYMDLEDVKFWREVQSRGTGIATPSGLGETTLFHATRFIAELFNISVSTIPKPLDGAITFWDEFPYGGAWQLWAPGFDWTKVAKKMIKPSDSDNVFVSTNGFSGAYGSTWSEFALSQTELVLDRMDKA